MSRAQRKDVGKPPVTPQRESVTLTCMHVIVYPKPVPRTDTDVFCYRCNKSVKVLHTPSDHYVKCRDCRYCRSYGNALHAARAAMWRHQGRMPAHTVDLWLGGKVKESYEALAGGTLHLQASPEFSSASNGGTLRLGDADDCPF